MGVSMLAPIDVFLLTDNCLLREMLVKVLSKKSDIRVLGAMPLVPEAIEQVSVSNSPVLIIDLAPTGHVGLQIIRDLYESRSDLRAVAIGMDADEDVFLRVVRSGVVGYMLKDASAADVVAAVRAVAHGDAVCPPHLCFLLFRHVARARTELPSLAMKSNLGLTLREQQLIPFIAQGLTNKEIALQLNLSERTVKNHVYRMLRKVGADSRLGVVEAVREEGILL